MACDVYKQRKLAGRYQPTFDYSNLVKKLVQAKMQSFALDFCL